MSFQSSTYRKYIADQLVTWLMTSHDPGRSRSRPRYIWDLISRWQYNLQQWDRYCIPQNVFLCVTIV